jgi:hypothetical protein
MVMEEAEVAIEQKDHRELAFTFRQPLTKHTQLSFTSEIGKNVSANTYQLWVEHQGTSEEARVRRSLAARPSE